MSEYPCYIITPEGRSSMSESGLDRDAMVATLHNLELLRDAKKIDLEGKKRQFQRLEAEIRNGSLALHNLNGTVAALKESLGLQTEEQGILLLQEAHPDADHLKG